MTETLKIASKLSAFAAAAAFSGGVAFAGPGINYGAQVQGPLKPEPVKTYTFAPPNTSNNTISVGTVQAAPVGSAAATSTGPVAQQPATTAPAAPSGKPVLPAPVVLYSSMTEVKKAQEAAAKKNAQAQKATAQPAASQESWLSRLESIAILTVFFGILIVLGISRAKNRTPSEKN